MIALDTNVFIYWLERNPDFYDASTKIISEIHSGAEPACCSVLVLSELYHGSHKSVNAVSSLPGLSVIEVTKDVAELAGKLRFTHSLRVIDAVHLATALHSGADKFITNDKPLARLKIQNLSIRLLTSPA